MSEEEKEQKCSGCGTENVPLKPRYVPRLGKNPELCEYCHLAEDNLGHTAAAVAAMLHRLEGKIEAMLKERPMLIDMFGEDG